MPNDLPPGEKTADPDPVAASTGDVSSLHNGRAQQQSRRTLFIALVLLVVTAFAAIGGLSVLAGRRMPLLTADDLHKAEELWRRNPELSYDMDVEVRGAQPADVHVEVRRGEVTAALINGREPNRRTWNVWSVLGQFETLERELEMAEDPEHEVAAATGTQWRLRCEFDSQFGYPKRYHRYVSGGGPDVFWRVTRFELK